MFEQFKENIRLTGETYVTARQELRSAIDNLKNAPRFKQGIWVCIVGAIVVPAIASHFSIPWYYQLVVMLGIVVAPLWAWIGKADAKNY